MPVMVTANTDALLKSLEEAKKTITRKLEGMVAGFSADVAAACSGATPVGDLASMQPVSEGGNARYRAYYEERMRDYDGLPIEPGFHRGAWEFGTPSFKPVINDVQGMINDVYNEAEANYKLGDTIVIGAEGPGYEMLLPRIEAPAIKGIEQAYKSNLQRHYDTAI